MKRLAIYSVLFVAAVVLATAQNLFEDLNDEFIRLNPDLGETTEVYESEKTYPFIRYDLNKITMHGDDWTDLAEKLSQSKTDADFTIVHIGDSHIQADGNTGTTRALFQNIYGDAGRGLIIPFKLAGTNQPLDYQITSPSRFVKATLMRMPWATEMGFTGVALHPETQDFSFNISVKSPCGFFKVLTTGDIRVKSIISEGREIPFDAEATDGGVDVSLGEDCKAFTVNLYGNNVSIFGFDLRNDSHGVLYHAIGNNGAAYASYNGIHNFGPSMEYLDPDLVVISLGTNEAFGKLSEENFNSQMSALIRKIRASVPESKLLLVTPSECQKSVYTRGSRGKGGKRSRSRTKSFQVNANVALVRRLILDYGKKNNIPVYDFYAVAGGEGSSYKWLDNKLLGADRIHRTWAGYHLDGRLIYDALSNALTNP